MAGRARSTRSVRSSTPPGPTWDALVFQGGGALGAYECGVYEALFDRGYDFDVVAGVSIGAANAAIVASRGKEAPTYLGRFWDELEDPMAEAAAPTEAARRQLSAWKSAYLGNPAMFTPRWVAEPWNFGNLLSWTSLYDPTPFRRLLERNIDFAALRSSNRRLIMTAVDVQSGALVAFDSHAEEISVQHVLASGALPPAFPAVRIGDRHYWDGGLVSNTPARKVLDVLPPTDERRIVLIELFPRRHHVPRTLLEVLSTMKDLTYMDRLDLAAQHFQGDSDLRDVIDHCLQGLTPKEKDRLLELPQYAALLRAHHHHVSLYLLTHTGEDGELDSKDYDFSPSSLRRHRHEGRHAAEEAISRWERREEWLPFCARRGASRGEARGQWAEAEPAEARATAR